MWDQFHSIQNIWNEQGPFMKREREMGPVGRIPRIVLQCTFSFVFLVKIISYILSSEFNNNKIYINFIIFINPCYLLFIQLKCIQI